MSSPGLGTYNYGDDPLVPANAEGRDAGSPSDAAGRALACCWYPYLEDFNGALPAPIPLCTEGASAGLQQLRIEEAFSNWVQSTKTSTFGAIKQAEVVFAPVSAPPSTGTSVWAEPPWYSLYITPAELQWWWISITPFPCPSDYRCSAYIDYRVFYGGEYYQGWPIDGSGAEERESTDNLQIEVVTSGGGLVGRPITSCDFVPQQLVDAYPGLESFAAWGPVYLSGRSRQQEPTKPWVINIRIHGFTQYCVNVRALGAVGESISEPPGFTIGSGGSNRGP